MFLKGDWTALKKSAPFEAYPGHMGEGIARTWATWSTSVVCRSQSQLLRAPSSLGDFSDAFKSDALLFGSLINFFPLKQQM
jgi:hypothetical protein